MIRILYAIIFFNILISSIAGPALAAQKGIELKKALVLKESRVLDYLASLQQGRLDPSLTKGSDTFHEKGQIHMHKILDLSIADAVAANPMPMSLFLENQVIQKEINKRSFVTDDGPHSIEKPFEVALSFDLDPHVLVNAPSEVKAIEEKEKIVVAGLEEAVSKSADLDIRISAEQQLVPQAPASLMLENSQAIERPKYKLDRNHKAVLQVGYGSHGIETNSNRLIFSQVGDTVDVEISGDVNPNIFIRDERILQWDPEQRELIGKGSGETEIYLTYKDKMKIVSVTVHGETSPLMASLDFPQDMYNLNIYSAAEGGGNSQLSAAYSEGLGDFIKDALNNNINPSENDENDQNEKSKKGEANNSSKLMTVEESRRAARHSVSEAMEQRKKIFRMLKDVSYQKMRVQVIEDRSNIGASQIFPINGARVKIVGTGIEVQTDAAGLTPELNLPSGSRFLVQVDDFAGRYFSSISEMAVSEKEPDTGVSVKHIKVISNLMHQTMLELVGGEKSSESGSICLDIKDKSRPLTELKVSTDLSGVNPVYLNKYGFIDIGQPSLSQVGRACIFNIGPGPFTIFIEDMDSNSIASFPANAFKGKHQHLAIDLSERFEISTNLVTSSAALLQSRDISMVNSYSAIDFADLYGFDSLAFLPTEYYGMLKSSDDILFSLKRGHYLAASPEFEPALYSIDKEDLDSNHATPLIPHGFVSDMSIEANIDWSPNPYDGSVLIEHGKMRSQTKENGMLQIELVSVHGGKHFKQYQFGDESLTKTVFFNVPPGQYSIMITTNKGYWLASDTVVVYSETLSVVQTGSSLRRFN